MEEKAVIGKEIFDLADQLKAKKQLKKDLEEKVKAVNGEIEQLDQQLSDAMAEVECPNFAHGGSTFYLNTRLFASPKSGMAEDMIQALKAHGYIQDTASGRMSQALSPQTEERISALSSKQLSELKKKGCRCLRLTITDGQKRTYSWETDGAWLTEFLTLNSSASPSDAPESTWTFWLERVINFHRPHISA